MVHSILPNQAASTYVKIKDILQVKFLAKTCASGYNSSENSSRDTFLTISRDDIILINSLHLKFRSVNCLSLSRALQKYLSSEVLKNNSSENFLQIIIKASVAQFIFSKALNSSEHL